MKPRKRVLLAVKIVPKKLGSMEDWIGALSAKLSLSFEVIVATYSPCHPSLLQGFAEANVKWIDLSMLERSFVASLRWIAKNVDTCHFSLFAPRDLLVNAAQFAPGVRVIFQDCFSSPIVSSRSSRITSQLADFCTFAKTDALIGVSDYVSARLRSRFPRCSAKVTTIYNGVDVKRFSSEQLPSGFTTIACVASLIPEKGVDVVVRAMAFPELCSVRLVVVGEGPMREQLEKLCLQLRVEDRVEFLGIRSDVERILQTSALAVHPALWGEAFGLTVVEYMAAGRPVVASAVGAIPEIVRDGETGVLVPPGDVRRLADAVRDLLDRPDSRDEMGRAARVRASSKFSLAQWVEGHLRLLHQVTRL